MPIVEVLHARGGITGRGHHARERRSRIARADSETVVEAAVDLNLGDRADAETDPDQMQSEEVALESRYRILDALAVVEAVFEQHPAGAYGLRIFRDERALLCACGHRQTTRERQKKDCSSHANAVSVALCCRG